jgi:hypothetical protein
MAPLRTPRATKMPMAMTARTTAVDRPHRVAGIADGARRHPRRGGALHEPLQIRRPDFRDPATAKIGQNVQAKRRLVIPGELPDLSHDVSTCSSGATPHDFLLAGPHAASGAGARRYGASWSGSGMRSPSRSRTAPASTAASAPPHQMASGLVCRRTPPIAGPRAREPVKVRL